MKKLLVPVDGSAASIKAAEKALEIARKFDSSITFVSVAFEPNLTKYNSYGIEWNAEFEKVTVGLKEHEVQVLENIIKKLDTTGITFDKVILSGEPYEEILKEANDIDCDLIVMGRRGFSKIKRFFVGSVTQRVISDAPCPVLIVKEE